MRLAARRTAKLCTSLDSLLTTLQCLDSAGSADMTVLFCLGPSAARAKEVLEVHVRSSDAHSKSAQASAAHGPATPADASATAAADADELAPTSGCEHENAASPLEPGRSAEQDTVPALRLQAKLTRHMIGLTSELPKPPFQSAVKLFCAVRTCVPPADCAFQARPDFECRMRKGTRAVLQLDVAGTSHMRAGHTIATPSDVSEGPQAGSGTTVQAFDVAERNDEHNVAGPGTWYMCSEQVCGLKLSYEA